MLMGPTSSIRNLWPHLSLGNWTETNSPSLSIAPIATNKASLPLMMIPERSNLQRTNTDSPSFRSNWKTSPWWNHVLWKDEKRTFLHVQSPSKPRLNPLEQISQTTTQKNGRSRPNTSLKCSFYQDFEQEEL